MARKPTCGTCGFKAKNQAGLNSHRRQKHPEPDPPTSNAAALEVTLDDLRERGLLDTIDAASIQALRSMAEALDDDPSKASLWKEYWSALREVLRAHGDADGDLQGTLEKIGGSAKVGDTTPA